MLITNEFGLGQSSDKRKLLPSVEGTLIFSIQNVFTNNAYDYSFHVWYGGIPEIWVGCKISAEN